MKILLIILLIYLLFMIIGATVYHAFHTKIKDDTINETAKTEYYSDTAGTERIFCVDDNQDALEWRLRLINEAQEEIIYSTFEFHDDTASLDILSALYEAAEKGVQVRLLVDGLGSGKNVRFCNEFRVLAAHENVELKVYNPINIFKPFAINLRMHEKYIISDRKLYMMGGRNTFDKFLGNYSEIKNIDREILVIQTEESPNSSLQQLLSYHDDLWSQKYAHLIKASGKGRVADMAINSLTERSKELHQLYPDAYKTVDYNAISILTNKITLLSNPINPNNKEPKLMYQIYYLMSTANQVTIQSPYVILSPWMYHELKEVSDSGVDISCITNSPETGANVFGCADYLYYRQDLLNANITLYELVADSSHTKAFFIDDRMAIVGSFNYDMRSTYLDTELMLAIDCPEFCEQLSSTINDQIDMSRLISPDGDISYGQNYTPVEMSKSRSVKLHVLGFVAKIIRYLL